VARILVVDDSLSVRKALEKILNSHAEVSVAISGEDALAQLHGDLPLPDLIISDVLMPGMSGPELVKSLKALERTAHVPVILISGIIDDEVHRQAHEVGAQAVVRKPFSADDLLPIVRHALNPGEAPLTAQTQSAASPGSPQEAAYEPELDTGRAQVQAVPVEAEHPVPEAAVFPPTSPVAATAEPPLTPLSGADSVEALLNPALAASPDAVAVSNVAQAVVPDAAGVLSADNLTPQVQPESGQNHPERSAARQPAAAAARHAEYAELVQALMQKPGVIGALVGDTAGGTHSQAGELALSASDLSMYARFFIGTADALGQRLGWGEAKGAQLDYKNGALLLLPLDQRHLLVCLLADVNSGSMVRFTLRRHLAAAAASV
jgi:CheY-like chemotaxis protein